MANFLPRRPAARATRWDSLALLDEDMDDSLNKLPGDVSLATHPQFSGDVGTIGKNSQDGSFGKLSDDILLAVLDRLNVREAARTSVLSRRWGQLPAMLSRLAIHVWDFLPDHVTVFYNADIARMNATVVEVTKSILARRDLNRNTIQQLSITFYLRDDEAISIGHAVGHAMATQKVVMAEFIVWAVRDEDQCDEEDWTDYGKQFKLFFDACPDAFGGLTRLHLMSLRFGESDIPNILITCKRLQDLRLCQCDSGSLTLLELKHAQLSVLSIVGCRFERVKLNWLPKLTQFTFDGWISYRDPLYVGHVPLLEAVNLANVCRSMDKVVRLSKFLGRTSVRDLKLGFKCEKIWVQPERMKSLASVFHQVRFVNLFQIPEGYDLTWTMFVLEIAPSLKELYLTVWDHFCKMEMDKKKRTELSYSEEKGVDWEPCASNFQHHCLATLVIAGFQSEDYMVKYVRRVMEAAPNLKDVFLYQRPSCSACLYKPPKPFMFPRTKRQKSSVKKRIIDGLFNSFAIIHFETRRTDHLAKQKYP